MREYLEDLKKTLAFLGMLLFIGLGLGTLVAFGALLNNQHYIYGTMFAILCFYLSPLWMRLLNKIMDSFLKP